ncbi:hypothetical protein [Pelagovum pacificum]|uniref:Uncharacterized protein n=1 Tax=Pelagovum pacificum TaxID=2588711 RepID=A0A5C5GFL2_9RHOB|nr:hypothetical protein [Pelagovum pacificum]QQA43311.1 hypothetical protein I8N54_01695 [Pelagovum pacificum]TNY33552.1 hypothetical protein FHY64_09830 [Pelagovum pacificum]
MARSRFVIAAAIAMIAGVAAAQTSRTPSPPAELPSENYAGSQYVDSRGCVYIRAGISGAVTWVPRVTRAREQLCGFNPTGSDGPTRSAQATQPREVPNPLEVGAAALGQDVAEMRTPAPQPQRVAAPAQPQPAARASAPAEPQPRVISLPQQPRGVVNPLTGAPVATAPAPSAPVVRASAPAPSAADEDLITGPTRMSRSAACALIARTGQQLLDQATGEPVACGGRRPAAPAPTYASYAQPDAPTFGRTVMPAAPATYAATTSQEITAPAGASAPAQAGVAVASVGCGNVSAVAQQYINTSRNVRCGPQAQPIFGGNGYAAATVSTRNTIPASNANAVTISTSNYQARTYLSTSNYEPITPPSGYERVWDDGRVNPSRGLTGVTAYVSSSNVSGAPVYSNPRPTGGYAMVGGTGYVPLTR